MAKPPIEYRQPRPASSSGRTADFGSAKPGSNPGAGAIKPFKLSDPIPDELLDGLSLTSDGLRALKQLAHKRKVKADQMKRYRARQKAAKT